ncbi:type I phosphomannose isomerase catalytic subunit [Clostridium saccharobutylicum]|uniref:Phosphohexomutase n=1 Tax=Clostridium saccharobutylicum DSM 13864 TaxID=1345695 RepID=U5MN60_CLOSA|nr:type I phosphomannose isomerase catalytic subunit [Clostridium saccharobutylicum]AGX42244.1 mannose-6-phosphate isomerase Pmi [Clostridium saccharobutylicum DSM 13864]AQR89525.1 mannose-6-phosphate isomerase ManA [Clostridium saccharobutylicum]AQR99427.1 mannose-6-phosphate isomerase ManA [Clostridium saccharobutylicum]AQS09158.1 mannose-6-phosphate isomerase ManA [Clostridium saccharobutylicum]AQS13413.1 mannose-6-phosphate isomerase ManA [Clostridium saccharobutylicum]
MYPIKFKNLYYERIWGGKDLEKFRDNVPSGIIGESWDIACHKNGTGTVINGQLRGKSFDEIIKKYGERLLGKEISSQEFPLLIKLITAQDKLSVQVHPDDEYANRVEKDSGKTEAWYVVDAQEGASLIVGTKDCDKEKFKKAINEGKLDKYLNKIPVKKGDFFYVQSGLVHAICEGVLIAEIQQSSDTTYRVYDYNRGREIHVDKALEVIDFNLKGENSQGIVIKKNGYDKTYLCLSKYFTIQKYEVTDSVKEDSDEKRFYLFTCVEGNGTIKYHGGEEKILMGDSILIPATLGEYELVGNFTLLKSYVPDLEEEEKKILDVVKR